MKLRLSLVLLLVLSIVCSHLVLANSEFHRHEKVPGFFQRIKRSFFSFFFGKKNETATIETVTSTTSRAVLPATTLIAQYAVENFVHDPKYERFRADIESDNNVLDDDKNSGSNDDDDDNEDEDDDENHGDNEGGDDSDDEDLADNSAIEGSSESSTSDLPNETTLEYYNVKFLINEPFVKEYLSNQSLPFQKLATILIDGIHTILTRFGKIESIKVSNIERFDADIFWCKASVDFSIKGASSLETINQTLYNHISNTRRIQSITLKTESYEFSRIPSLLSVHKTLENNGCLSSQIRCKNGDCISVEYRCNGLPECTDGSDEQGCGDIDPSIDAATTTEKDTYFTIPPTTIHTTVESVVSFDDRCRSDDKVRCGNLTVFVCTTNLCDSVADCPNNFDEENCSNEVHIIECKENEFQCDKTKCVSKQNVCNGLIDCDDSTDEENCQTKHSSDQQLCSSLEFRCDQYQCISLNQFCDGVVQCRNGLDEQNCSSICDSSKFRCNDGTCIIKSHYCNRIFDCPDKSDEANCETTNCTASEFRCATANTCIDIAYKCNGKNDCSDGSDERDCGSVEPTKTHGFSPCHAGEFDCGDGQCIDAEHFCDGIKDCDNNEDEVECVSRKQCQSDEFMCKDGLCLKQYMKCDGIPQCENAEDEYYCQRACDRNEFRCDNFTCIANEKKCDRVVDCANGADENDCYIGCSANEHTCGDGRCLPRKLVCNAIRECADGSDETNCGCASDEFTCSTGECIKSFLQCDGKRDCIDGSDEVNEYCRLLSGRQQSQNPILTSPSTGDCLPGMWKCNSGPCIDSGRVCDRNFDCNDFSDELNCPFGAENELDLKTYPSSQQIKENVIKEGREVVFQCRDEGPLRATVRWTRPNQRPLPIGARDIKGRLEIPNIKISDSGQYICEAVDYRSRKGFQKIVSLQVEKTTLQNFEPAIRTCAYNEATCVNGQCIAKTAVCDGKSDCSDGSDENRCSMNGCEPNEFRCLNKKCILKIWRCDGDNDCDDHSDENDCEHHRSFSNNSIMANSPCSSYQFHCPKEDKCIPRSYHCDLHRDCLDGFDEIGCMKPTILNPPPSAITVSAGDTLIITCKAVGVPIPEVNWRLNWGHVPEKCSYTSLDGLGTLTCPNVQERDQGAYSCEAINIKGQIIAVPDAIVVVANRRQRVCPPGYFNDDALDPSECIKCFCFGNAVECRSANLFTFQLNTPFESHKMIAVTLSPYNFQVKIEHSPYYNNALSRVDPIGSKGFRARLEFSRKMNDHQYPYFAMPDNYLGPMLNSYGGYIKYTVYIEQIASPLSSFPDCIISGNGLTLTSRELPIEKGKDNNVTIRFFTGEWFKDRTKTLATREEIMMVLADVQDILIKVQYIFEDRFDLTIRNIEIDSADVTNTGLGKAAFVEQCECPSGYFGHSCEKCESSFSRVKVGPWLGTCSREISTCAAGYYRDASRSSRCEPCPCPMTIPSNQFGHTCRLDYDGNVQCDCKTGYVGRRCEMCDVNYSGNPLIAGDSCQLSSCSRDGSIGNMLDEHGNCKCKQYVTGRQCDQCLESTFYLNSHSKYGCVSCFCMGVSNQCSSSSWYRHRIESPFSLSTNDFTLINSETKNQTNSYKYEINSESHELYVSELSYEPNGIYYWKLPSRYLGNKITSYGGNLTYTIRYVPTPGGQSSKNVAADVEIVSSNDITLNYYHKMTVLPNVMQTISVQFVEDQWQRSDGKIADREHLLMALADVQNIFVKATYTTSTAVTYLSSVVMDDATEMNTGLGVRADAVEQCRCPVGYKGLSCEDCDSGYTRSNINGLYLGVCEKCSCNEHATQCDPDTGMCLDCNDNTYGHNCELCAPGYERDANAPLYEPCKRQSNRQYDECDCLTAGSLNNQCVNGVCQCKSNVMGPRCDRCKPKTFGLDDKNPHGCIACFCSGVSDQCTSISLFVDQIPIFITQDGARLALIDIYQNRQINSEFKLNPSRNEQGANIKWQLNESPNLYWSLPAQYLGDRILSYNGNLEFKQRFVLGPASRLRNDRDILITGNGITIVWSNPVPLNVSAPDNKIIVSLSPTANWYRYEEKRALQIAARNDIMIVLANVESILIRAAPFDQTWETFISDIALDTVSSSYTLSNRQNKLVETCKCPEGHEGYSCEKCKEGYFHDKRNGNVTPFGICKKCPCNGNEKRCYAGTFENVVCECKKGFDGNFCERQATFVNDRNTSVENDLMRPRPFPATDRPTIIVTISNPTIQIVEIGQRVTFNCSAYSIYSTPLRIYWRKENGELPFGRSIDDDRGLLVISDVQVSDSGVYVCHADDNHLVVTEKRTLSVGGNPATAPQVFVRPPELTVYEGNPIDVMCETSGNPEPNLKWIKTDGFMNPEHDFNNGRFQIYRSRKFDEGEYRCIATNTFGSREAIVKIRVLSRAGQTSVLPIIMPTVYEGPEGKDVMVTCRSDNAKKNGIKWQRINGNRLPYGTQQNNGILMIKAAKPEDSGIYVCNVTSVQDQYYQNEIRITIIPDGSAPSVRLNHVEQVVSQGDSIDIVCHVTGTPKPIVKWIRNGDAFDPNVKQVDNILRFENAQITNRGHYICIATNLHGEAQTSTLVEIERREKPLAKIYPEGTQKVNSGGSVVLQCRTTGVPIPVVTWSRPGGESLPKTADLSLDPRILKISHVTHQDAGVYMCTVENLAGKHSVSTSLIVQVAPTVRINPNSNQMLVRKGDKIHLICSGSGEPEPQVKWSKLDDGVIKDIQNESSHRGETIFMVVRAEEQHGGSYMCEATSDAGTDRKYINVIVRDADDSARGDIPIDGFDDSRENNLSPVSQTKPVEDVLVPVNKTAVLTCRVEGNLGKVVFNWKRANNVPFSENSYSREGVLVIGKLQPQDTGEYICYGTLTSGRQIELSRAYLKIKQPPKITLDPIKQYVRPGDNAVINCQATGDQPIELKWTLPNDPATKSSRVLEHQGLLRFERIEVSDTGRYVCTAKNAIGTSTAIAEVIVEDDNNETVLTFVWPQNEIVNVVSGETAVLQCQTRDPAIEQVQWSREDYDTASSKLFASHDSVLRIQNAQESDSGMYRCKVNSPQGPKSAFIQLNVTHCRDVYANTNVNLVRNRNDLMQYRAERCDFCSPNPCRNGGQCERTRMSKVWFVCRCTSGFYGDRCEHRLRQFCGPSNFFVCLLTCTSFQKPLGTNIETCGTGKCVERENSFECRCPFGKSGLNCEQNIEIIEPAFSENSYLTYTVPKLRDRNQNSVKFGLQLKPISVKDGIVLYCGENRNGFGDFVSIQIKDKFMEFRASTGNEPIVLKSNRQLAPHEWVTITAGRIENQHVLIINNETVITQTDNRGGMMLKTPLYIGGYDDEKMSLNRAVDVAGGFHGCVKQVDVSGFTLDLTTRFSDSSNVHDCRTLSAIDAPCQSAPCLHDGKCVETNESVRYRCDCTHQFAGRRCEFRNDICYQLQPCLNGGTCHSADSNSNYMCDCPLGFGGIHCEQSAILQFDVKFNGRGYIEISRDLMRTKVPDDEEFIALELATNTTEGLVLWYGQETAPANQSLTNRDYLALVLHGGYLEFWFDFGSGDVRLHNSQLFVSDGQKHRIILKRQKTDASIEIDDEFIEFGSSPVENPPETTLNCDGNLYLGGLPNIGLTTANRFSVGFKGCIHAFEIQNSNTLNLGTVAISGRNVDSCSRTMTSFVNETHIENNYEYSYDTDYPNEEEEEDTDLNERFVN